MNTIKHIFQAFSQMFKQLFALLTTLASYSKDRRERAVRAENEAERLDRIRHPYKYLGK
jgi:hypothetical protein